jgi:hypothetical protein
LSYAIEVKSQEKKPVYAHGTSTEPWLEVGRAKLNGRTATINLSVPSVPNKDGETLKAKLIVQSNGNQRFVVPVTLQVGNNLVFGAAEPMPVVEAVKKTPSKPVIVVPAVAAAAPSAYRRRRSVKQKPSWIHLLPALLLFLAVLTAVLFDLMMKTPAGVVNKDDDIRAGGNPAENWKYDLKDPDPRIAVRFDEETERFGLEMTKEDDPRYRDKHKKLTFDDHGKSNNTIIKIDSFEYKFGNKTPNNVWGGRGGILKQKPIPGRKGWTSTMEFTSEKVQVVQHVEIVPGQSGYLDTVLVFYTIQNNDEGKHKVGIRVMLDTYIGANDGVPFTIPGQNGFVDTKVDLSEKQIPDYIEVIENPKDPKNPGTVARMGLSHIRLPGMELEAMEKLRICRFPGKNAEWDWEPVLSMKTDNPDEQPDSCVAMYWPYHTMNPKATRRMGFTYGLSSLEIGGGGGNNSMAISVPASVQPDNDFIVTAYVWNANKGDKVTLQVPSGLKFADGYNAERTVEEGGERSLVFWHLRSGGAGEFTLEAKTDKAKAKPKKVVVKATSIFG